MPAWTSPAPTSYPAPPPYVSGTGGTAEPPDGAATGWDGRAQQAVHSGRVTRVLPLGTGLALTGLGLAFLGLRLRRS
ncbi:hypothetical protein CD790_12215 [Streptomyces sp. SAJ15]|nr:hypothetical protein CD790_12215 [Streptomyces sp. SAJ15]